MCISSSQKPLKVIFFDHKEQRRVVIVNYHCGHRFHRETTCSAERPTTGKKTKTKHRTHANTIDQSIEGRLNKVVPTEGSIDRRDRTNHRTYHLFQN